MTLDEILRARYLAHATCYHRPPNLWQRLLAALAFRRQP